MGVLGSGGQSMTETEIWSKWESQVVNGTFPLRRFLGRSNHSVVFLTDFRAQNLVNAAIKIIPADPARADGQLARWKVAAELSHPHLIRLLESGRCKLGGHPFLFAVTEYAEQNLAQILPHRALTVDEVREMLAPALDALAFLHSQNLVHGQLKPANFLVVDDQLKLASDTIRRRGMPPGSTGPETCAHSAHDCGGAHSDPSGAERPCERSLVAGDSFSGACGCRAALPEPTAQRATHPFRAAKLDQSRTRGAAACASGTRSGGVRRWSTGRWGPHHCGTRCRGVCARPRAGFGPTTGRPLARPGRGGWACVARALGRHPGVAKPPRAAAQGVAAAPQQIPAPDGSTPVAIAQPQPTAPPLVDERSPPSHAARANRSPAKSE